MRSATLNGAEVLRADDRLGSVEPSKLANLTVLSENPLVNFKTLYGAGHIKLDGDGKLHRIGVVEYSIKDGVVYDAEQLLADVRTMVADDKLRRGISELPQP